MKIHALFASYNDSNLDLELVDAWDEYAVDANPDGFYEACQKLSRNSEIERWVEVILEVSEQLVRSALHPEAVVLPAEVVTTNPAGTPEETPTGELCTCGHLERWHPLSGASTACNIGPCNCREFQATDKDRVDEPLSWHYGPTDTDREPGNMWCYDCGWHVYGFEGGYGCTGCGATSHDAPEETP